MVKGSDASDKAIMAAIVAFGAGYITTEQGQIGLKAATEARYIASTDVFVFSSLGALFFEVMSNKFLTLKEYPAVCMMLASSSIAHIILQCRGGFALMVYLPPAFVFFVFFIPERVHDYLSNGVAAVRRFGWIIGIPNPGMAVLDQDIPL